jgi:hypothetical protein
VLNKCVKAGGGVARYAFYAAFCGAQNKMSGAVGNNGVLMPFLIICTYFNERIALSTIDNRI